MIDPKNFSFLPGEAEAIKMVVRFGNTFGYGNLISHLKRAWIKHLMREYNVSWEAAVKQADVDPYPYETAYSNLLE